MARPKTIGFPRMMKEPSEKRVFLPEFIQFLANSGLDVFIEEGYGSRSGFSFEDYQQASYTIHMCTREEAFAQDIVLVLRSPTLDELKMIPRGACLISMLHYPTRPLRVERLCELGIKAISLDSIVNDSGIRLVENMKAVAWNGLEAAFDTLENCWPGLNRPDGEPIQVLILGTGMVGKHAVDAATKLGNIERNSQHMREKGPGSVAITLGRNVSSHLDTMKRLFSQADILVDATQRRNASVPVVPNEWLGWLPEHAVVADLAVDPYTLNCNPEVVRGVEGIPQGNLDQYIFLPTDPNWDNTVPPSIPSKHRRAVATCYSWPGIHPETCMRHYAQQLTPLIEVLIQIGYDGLSPEGSYFERALYRATLDGWNLSVHNESHPC
jgi:alanine dehydrogenase